MAPDRQTNAAKNDAERIGVLHAKTSGAETTWFLLSGCKTLAVNGSPLLPIRQLDPGSVLSLGSKCWWISSFWQPRPVDAPADLADKLCPVCGATLGLVPVVRCACGRWTHLERPEEPTSQEALNCYLAAPSCPCGLPATLEAQISPEPPGRLLPVAEDQSEEWS
jgi:hypothetical protein